MYEAHQSIYCPPNWAPAKECIAVFDSATLSLGLAGSKGPPCVLFSGEASCYGFVHNSLQKDLGRMRV